MLDKNKIDDDCAWMVLRGWSWLVKISEKIPPGND